MRKDEEQNPPENRNINTGGGNYNERIEGDYIQGNVFQNIFHLGGQTTTPVGNPARPKNERILLAAVKEEVTARLRQSLHNAVLINLGKESQPQQVKRPWDAEIKIGSKPAEPLSDTTTILQVFDSEEIAGKLLILGAPGAGKTTTQLELAQALVQRAEEQPDYPVPVLFNLSSWKDDRQSLTDWLVAELKSKYGVSTKLGQDWVDNHQLLPLLDGLDELEPQRQELCVYAINQFLASETRPLYLVVCSRSEEYTNYATQLQLNGAIYLQPLTKNQIYDYLTSIKYIELWSIISNDINLLELVKTPLLVSITVLVYQEISIEEWQHLNSTADRIQYLLDAYVGRMLIRNINSRTYFQTKPPNAKRTRIWLVWLAQQMEGEAKTEFLIEEIQPSLFKSKFPKIIYNLIVWGVIQMLISGLISGLIFGLISGLIFGFHGLEIENKTIPNQGIWQSAKNIVKLSALLFFPSTILIFLIQKILLNNSFNEALIFSLMSGLLLGLLVGIPRSGTPVIKHFILRLVLYCNGYIPWNYARFLDYCTERMLLQRVGGRYRFIHKLLQDHFAQMEFKRN
ncbi:NACHT domain-containing protein [Nostoc sp. CCY0012]|uniref:NACHT domain-containing protein n=1 Tax=Nostoc sp. CCY0012 TaxID=1056123 RepID=UPI0039C60E86